MSGISWPNLVSGAKAKASEVELKFDWLEGHIVPMLGGSKTNGVYDLGESAYHFNNAYINNLPSTTSINVNSLSVAILKAGTSANLTNTTIGNLSVTSETVNSLTVNYLIATGYISVNFFEVTTSANMTNTTIGNLTVTNLSTASVYINSVTTQYLKAGTSVDLTNTTIGNLSVTSETVNSLTANNIILSTATTRYIAVSAPSFVENQNYAGPYFTRTVNYLKLQTTTSYYYWQAPIFFPQNAIITSLRLRGYNTTGSQIVLELQRTTFAASNLASVILNGAGGSFLDTITTSMTNNTIDNNTYAYGLQLTMQANNQEFNSAIITYTILSPLP